MTDHLRGDAGGVSWGTMGGGETAVVATGIISGTGTVCIVVLSVQFNLSRVVWSSASWFGRGDKLRWGLLDLSRVERLAKEMSSRTGWVEQTGRGYLTDDEVVPAVCVLCCPENAASSGAG